MNTKKKLKIAIVGGNGFIGSNLVKYFKKVSRIESFKVSSKEDNDFFLDLEYPEKFDYTRLSDIDFVVFTAAISSPDMCANDYEKAYKINVLGTKKFIEETLQKGCKVIFLSSDAVYGSDIGVAFDESVETRADTAYGIMKKEIEDCFYENELFKSLRLSYVISNNDKFMNYVKSCINSSKTVEVFHPFYRNCVTLKEVLHTIEWLIFNWNEFDSPFLNLCGRELISRIDIIDEYLRRLNNKFEYTIVNPSDTFFKNRHKCTEMSSLYLYNIIDSFNKPFSIRLREQLLYDEI